jgi:hypothetical protein
LLLNPTLWSVDAAKDMSAFDVVRKIRSYIYSSDTL